MCLSVELNTFFLILRRLWHVPPVSVCFYVTWITIRLIIYPYLIYVFAILYVDRVRARPGGPRPTTVARLHRQPARARPDHPP